MTKKSSISAVMGLQWGDEGKGKLVDILMQDTNVCCRFNGGSNAGHTIVANGKKYALHLLPSGVLNTKATNVLGNGVVCHLKTFFQELEQFGQSQQEVLGRIRISNRATLVLDLHQIIDAIIEASLSDSDRIGTTKRGIGPAYASKISRTSIRVVDLQSADIFAYKVRQMYKEYMRMYGQLPVGVQMLGKYDVEEEISRHLNEYLPRMKGVIVDTHSFLFDEMEKGSSILAEGANAVMLDIDHGTYPYVTSSSTTSGGICTGLGVPPTAIENVYGVVKAYTSRVGEGPFPTELLNADGDKLRETGHEYGTTTGRPRRCGWLDLVQLKYRSG
eukprot:GHVH01004225.1.p1 GENE.GHVH01004225.1~~GHVH01004225.1.p1  ORF type:complete len:331 (+),score=42.11 GHVH01004225.1:843-1835(+)